MKIRDVEIKNGDIAEIEYPNLLGTKKYIGRFLIIKEAENYNLVSTITNIFGLDFLLVWADDSESFNTFNSKKVLSIKIFEVRK